MPATPSSSRPATMADQLQDRVVAAIGDLYDVEAEIGRGGSAVVYRATDVRLRRKVALKVLPPELAYRDEVRSRFLREAQTAAQLSHPNIVPIYSVDEREGLVYLVMQLVDGESLATRLVREPRPPLDVVRRVLREVADALAYAHAHGIIHRDIKPDNILLESATGRALVTDFGIARAIEEGSRLTLTGIAVGTPAYMSPEQALGEREVDPRTDVYSLGVVGYQMLAGEPPFRATNTPAMLMKHISDLPAPLAPCRPDVPGSLCEAVERALAKRPEDRWPDVVAFRDAIMGSEGAARPGVVTHGGSGASGTAGPVQHADRTATAAPAPAPAAPLPAPRASRPVPQPAPPPFPEGGDRDARDAWRLQQRAWREQVRAERHHRPPMQADGAPLGAPFGVPAGAPVAAGQPSGLDARFEAFRRQGTRAAVTLTILTFINLVTLPVFPWVIFPAMGILGKLRRAWEPLRDAGVTLGDVMSGSLPAHLRGSSDRLPAREVARQARALGKEEARRQRRLVYWRDFPALERSARIFRMACFASGIGGVTGLISVSIGAGVGLPVLVVPSVLGVAAAAVALPVAAVSSGRLRRAGLRLRELLRGDWLERMRAADPRGPEELAAEELRRLAPPDVLAGPHGDAVRRAVRDRVEVRETFARMSETDRALLPDVTATVDGLVDRVGMLAQALHRLDEDRPEEMLRELEARLARAEEEQLTSPDQERRLALLQRQRETLRDLATRRATLAGQLESAALVLQSVRLDLLKLRSAGVQAALGNVTSATQEARALSRDIEHLLDAVDEVRAL